MHPEKFDVLIIGAGVHGLATAFHLADHRGVKVGILERLKIGHPLGSSHGASRMTRSIYTNPKYIPLIQRCRSYEWPLLEKAIGTPLIYPNPVCWMGPNSIFESILQTKNVDLEPLELSSARKRFPQFQFSEGYSVILDQTGGVIAAKKLIAGLSKSILAKGVAVREETEALEIDPTKDPIEISTNQGLILANRLIVTAGPWILKLIPSLRSLLIPIRQTVGYFKLRGDPKSYRVGNFPCWAHINEKEVFYGLPEFGCEGIKVAKHITKGTGDDPDRAAFEHDLEQIEILTEFVRRSFTEEIERFVGSETCFYTNTKTEDFILDFLDGDQRIVIGSACSGHGFKFAPIIGRILSELAMHGKTNIPEFEASQDLFTCAI